jgi:serine/threonine-protein phosphatase 6 regulatory subunit 3
LTGRVDGGLNRELAIALFRDAKLMHRIIEGQKRNDAEWYSFNFIISPDLSTDFMYKYSAKPKGVRLGYMGHLTLISEDVIGALDHFPPDLRSVILQYSPATAWDEYVTGRYSETKKKDSCLLGGGKPVVSAAVPRAAGRWKVDEEDNTPLSGDIIERSNGVSETRGEFRRAGSVHLVRESTADFGSVAMDDRDSSSSSSSSSSRPPQVFLVFCSVVVVLCLPCGRSTRNMRPRRLIHLIITGRRDLMTMTMTMADG